MDEETEKEINEEIENEEMEKEDEEDSKALELLNEEEAPENIGFENLHTLLKSWAQPDLEFLGKDITTANLKGKQGNWLLDVSRDLETYNVSTIFGWDKFGELWKNNAMIKAIISKGDNAKFLDNVVTQKAELKKSGLSSQKEDKWKRI